MDEERLSLVCGWALRYRRVPLARLRFSWPLGRISIDAHELVLSIRGPLGTLLTFAARLAGTTVPIVIPLPTITRVVTRDAFLGIGGLRIEWSHERPMQASVALFRDDLRAAVQCLSNLGAPVTQR